MTAIPAELHAHFAHEEFANRCRALIVENSFARVCDLGGGRSPLLLPAEVDRLGLDYIVLDVSASELEQGPSQFRRIRADICTMDEGTLSDVDFLFSHMVAEHVSDGAKMHEQVFRMLRPGGMAFHMFPTLFSPLFVANRIVPHRLADLVSRRLYEGKKRFPARYSRCFGPTPRMHKLLHGIGFEVLEYRPFYSTGYFASFPLLARLDEAIGSWASARRNPHLTSYAWLLVRRPLA